MVPLLRFLKNAPNSGTLNWLSWRWWMMNYFCGMVDQRKMFSLISSWDHCQRSSPWWISNMPRAGFEPAQNLSSGLVEWSCAVVITTTLRFLYVRYNCSIDWFKCSINVTFIDKIFLLLSLNKGYNLERIVLSAIIC